MNKWIIVSNNRREFGGSEGIDFKHNNNNKNNNNNPRQNRMKTLDAVHLWSQLSEVKCTALSCPIINTIDLNREEAVYSIVIQA